ncbi:hypothetical protein SAMN02745248_00998 [Hathewaya proteolytica DSM 3090]|uniref:Uncharacterized protein n=1 Tax=Hathewaya proteolytica DSM 3090 TaxID=1121331 RepID=A0A1M6MCJ8_9CLOT|nr:hypothetical protein [Hathewaya proteolytica]SHJ81130.1 hypothetical protein SAMN02745248_00998 [Hathewaya proteolytica DSM 3090]
MKKVYSFLALTMILVFISSGFAFSTNKNDIPEPIIKAANEGLVFVSKELSANPTLYGLDSSVDVKSIKLGEGFNLYYPKKDKINKTDTDSLIDVSDKSNFWLFTVKANGKPAIFLTVGYDYDNGEYDVAEFGGNSQVFEETLANFKNVTNNEKPKVVKIRSDYYLVNKTELGESTLPSISEERSKQFNNKKLVNSKDIINELKDYIKQSKDGGRGTSTQVPKQTKNNIPILEA